MKPYLKIEKQALPFHEERSFLKALKHTSHEHGFSGPFAQLSFLWARNTDHWLQVISRIMPFNGVRVKMQRMRGVIIEHDVHIGPMVTIDDVYPNFVKIGAGSSIAGQNFILTHTKPLKYHSEVSEAFVAPVIIGKNVWVAINVVILPGVTIGEGSIVASGSVVTKSIPPFVFAAGIPAIVKKDIASQLRKNYSPAEYETILSMRKEEYGF